MRKRVDQLGVTQPEIQRIGRRRNRRRAARRQQRPARRSRGRQDRPAVLLRLGAERDRPQRQAGGAERTDASPADPDAGVRRRPGCPSTRRCCGPPNGRRSCARHDTTWRRLHARAGRTSCIYGSWYLLDTEHEKVSSDAERPQETEAEPVRRRLRTPPKRRQAEGRARQPRHRARAGPTGRSDAGKVTQPSPNSCYVLNDDPVLNGTDITNPQQSFDEGAGGPAQPNVTFGFTSHGKSVFERVTKEIAHRGQEAQLPGVTNEAALQHFAVVLDGQLITAPSIDFTQYPEGIDADHRLADLRRLHDHLGAEPRQRAAVRRAADQAGTDLQLAGLGDARQNGARTGPDRGARRLRGGVPVPARRSTACSARSRSAAWSIYGDLLLRADQADPDHADAAGDRRPDPDDRRRARTRTS